MAIDPAGLLAEKSLMFAAAGGADKFKGVLEVLKADNMMMLPALLDDVIGS